ncbi:MAG: NRDE family protein [Gammaproteobacteria bacterium]|nr:NRDE family protein [Gammaproteobacteria bacterium]
MCLLIVAQNQHPDFPFIFAGNRDEMHARPTALAHWWQDAPNVFGGRDKQAGGAWLGLRNDGRFAVITNYRDPATAVDDPKSRGHIVHRFLTRDMSPAEFSAELAAEDQAYNGYNLLFGDITQLHYHSNRQPAKRNGTALEPGIHALSNHLLDTEWPKVTMLRGALEGIDSLDESNLLEHLLSALGNTDIPPDNTLPDTGVGLELERPLGAAKIITPNYGTRASTVILVDRNRNTLFHELSYQADGRPADAVNKRIELKARLR